MNQENAYSYVFQDLLPIEKRVQKLFLKIPRYDSISKEMLETLDLLGIGEREELLQTLSFAKNSLLSHLRDFEKIEQYLAKTPRLKALNAWDASRFLSMEEIQPLDVISVWDSDKRKYYYVVRNPGHRILAIRLNQKLKIDGRTRINEFGYSHALEESYIKFGRIEMREQSLEQFMPSKT